MPKNLGAPDTYLDAAVDQQNEPNRLIELADEVAARQAGMVSAETWARLEDMWDEPGHEFASIAPKTESNGTSHLRNPEDVLMDVLTDFE